MFIAKMKSELFLSQFKRVSTSSTLPLIISSRTNLTHAHSRQAQEAYLLNDLSLCRHRCTELLETPALHLDTRIETLQLLATVVPLPVAQEHLSDALCLLDLAVERGGIAPGQMQALLGLRVTTLDMLGRLERDLRGMEREEEADAWKARGSLRASKKR